MRVPAHAGQETPLSVAKDILQQDARPLNHGIRRIGSGIVAPGGEKGRRIVQGEIAVRVRGSVRHQAGTVAIGAAPRVGNAHQGFMLHLSGLELRQRVGIEIPVDVPLVAPRGFVFGLSGSNHLVVIILRAHSASGGRRNAPDIVVHIAVPHAAADADCPDLLQLALEIQHRQQGFGIEPSARRTVPGVIRPHKVAAQHGDAHRRRRILVLETGRQHRLGTGIMLPAENGGNRVLLATVGSVAQPERAFILGGYHRAQGKTVRFITPVPGVVNSYAVLLPMMGKTGVSRQLRSFLKIRRLQDQVNGTAGAVCPERTGLAAGNGPDGAFDNFNIFYQGRIHAVSHAAGKRHVAYLHIGAGKTADGVLVRRAGQQHVSPRIDGGIHAQGLHQGIGTLGIHQIPRNNVYRLRNFFRLHVREGGGTDRLRPQGLGTDGHHAFRHFLHALLCGGGFSLGIGGLPEDKQAPNGGGTVQTAPLAAAARGIHVG